MKKTSSMTIPFYSENNKKTETVPPGCQKKEKTTGKYARVITMIKKWRTEPCWTRARHKQVPLKQTRHATRESVRKTRMKTGRLSKKEILASPCSVKTPHSKPFRKSVFPIMKKLTTEIKTRSLASSSCQKPVTIPDMKNAQTVLSHITASFTTAAMPCQKTVTGHTRTVHGSCTLSARFFSFFFRSLPFSVVNKQRKVTGLNRSPPFQAWQKKVTLDCRSPFRLFQVKITEKAVLFTISSFCSNTGILQNLAFFLFFV